MLAPSPASVRDAQERGYDAVSLRYYAARVIAAGTPTSQLESPTGQRYAVDNVLLVPLTSGVAEPGQDVLTVYGADAKRARVMRGGTPERPRLRFFGHLPDSEQSFAPRDELSSEYGFRVIGGPGQVGASLACGEQGQTSHWMVVRPLPGRWLALGYGGRLRVVSTAECRALPVAPPLAPGQAVRVPRLGEFIDATVRRLERDTGQVWVELVPSADRALYPVAGLDVSIG